MNAEQPVESQTVTVTRVKRTITVWAARCVRCGHTWDSTARKKPTRCPGCGSRGFDRPARAYQRRK